MLLGIVPFGLIAGVSAVEAGLDPLHAVGLSVVVFAGASQLAAIELFGRDAPLAIIVVTVLVINLRMMMYSVSIAPHFRRFALRWKALCAYVLTDQAYALSVTEYRQTDPGERSRKWYYLGAAFTLWVVWQVTTVAGVALGASVPAGLSLEFAIPLTFMALLFPALSDRTTELVALVAGAIAIPAAALPYDLGLVVSAVLALTVGTLYDWRSDTDTEPDTGGDHDAAREGAEP
ncbi:AzlC family ABC transporter permease [Haloarchaeobius amylolyticus]|uniref:AzlC family ABC transporter permease n=1 Tax=Haloarchaeobius amylolyticus TaxID=1198296 RepID=UPI0026E51B49|nr:AzlC family ABC transporter permease [Haloarchaeobius amylolyticus]